MPSEKHRSRKKRLRIHAHPLFIGSCTFVLIGLLLLVLPLLRMLREHGFTLTYIRNMITQEDIPVRHSDGRTNILILGNPGGTTEGSDLTDTILYVSVHTSESDALLLSIPRDLWIAPLSEKINMAYQKGEEHRPGSGLDATTSIINDVLGQTIHYTVRLDFSGFTRIIDILGGIDIIVERPIDDWFYPVPGREDDLCDGDPALGCRYEHLRFDSGMQHMDGKTALKYVRSRQSIGEEGTDFSRSQRQQQVLVAVKTKLLTYVSWQQRAKLYAIADELRSATETDMKLSDMLFFFRRFTQLPDDNIRRLALDLGDEKTNRPGLLVNPPPNAYFGAWVLVPRTGTFDEIHQYVACHLENPACQFSL